MKQHCCYNISGSRRIQCKQGMRDAEKASAEGASRECQGTIIAEG